MPGEAMKCGKFERIVHDLVRPGQLSRTEAATACAHAETCPACSRRLAEAERLAAILKEASAEIRGLSAPARVESSVMDAFRAAGTAMSRRRPRRPWRLALGWASAGAVASLIVFAWLGRGPVHPSSLAARAGAAEAESKTLATAETMNSVAQAEQNPASGFVPVPFSGGFVRGDSAVIVRVQVPRTALAELGYPVDDSQGGGVVQADLLVGEDGWPHAVRIVQ
jgi:hypothetical protein